MVGIKDPRVKDQQAVISSLSDSTLSTAVFVLWGKKGLALINGLPGIEGLIIDAQHKLHYSEGLLARSK